jgi:hypothetical protein
MKKFFKLGCFGFIGLVVLIVVIASLGGEEEKVSTGTEATTAKSGDNTKKEAAKEDGSKKVDASSQTMDAIGLKVALGEIKVSKDKIQVGMNVENTNDKKVSFYPDQGSAVVGDMQLDANMFLTDGKISGDIQGGVKQEAVIEFLAPEGKEIDVKSVQQIKLIFGEVVSEDFMNTKAVEFVVPVK